MGRAAWVLLVVTACGGARANSREPSPATCDAKTCVAEGDRFYEGRMATPKNPFKALDFYSKGCELRMAEGCAKAATMMISGDGVTADIAKGYPLLVRACELGDSGSCNNAGVAWSEGKNGATAVNHGKARAFYEKACKLENGLGCFNLGNVYRIGEGVPVDLNLAFDHFKRSCGFDEAKGCTELAILYFEGSVVKQDVAAAKKLFEKSCKLGSQPACKNLEILQSTRSP